MASRLENEWGKTAGVQHAIATLVGKSEGLWRAEILVSTNLIDRGTVWAVADTDLRYIGDREAPFLCRYASEDQFVRPIPLDRVKP